MDVLIDPLSLSDLTDLPKSENLTSDDIPPILRDRYLEGIHTISVGPRVLISINPYQFDHQNSDQVLAEWAEEYEDCGQQGVRGRLPPHLWGVSSKAYYFMKRTGQDQTIIMSGESSSGKTEATRLLLKSFINLATPPSGKRGSKLAASIPAAFFVLDCFGHASTLANSNASRFGRYTELQFNEKGYLVGLKGLEYYLEKARVTGAGAGERNFHIFHYLVAGANDEERHHLHLDHHPSYRYLTNNPRASSSNSPDATRFLQLKEGFKLIGFPKRAISSIFQTLAAILHLGNLEFHMDRSINPDSALVKNVLVLDIVAELLGVDAQELETALTNKSILVSGEVCGVFLDPEAASVNRDDLAKALYGLVFSWIGEYLNEKLCRDDFSTFVALVDFPGPVKSTSSHRDGCGLDAFCFNLASERLHAFTLEQIFEADKAEYIAEGLDKVLPGINTPYSNNKECVRVLTNIPGGLVHIIDDQSHRKGKTDATMLKAMGKRWDNHASFGCRDGDEALGRAGTFLCSHWSGQVTYSAENFLSSNSTALSPNFVSLLGGSTPKIGADGMTTASARDQLSTGGSTHSFIRQLFASGAVETVAHPRSEATIVAASQKIAPRRAPSTKRPRRAVDTAKADEEEDEPPKSRLLESPSVVKEFDESLSVLLSTLSATKVWNIFCLRPNDTQLPNQLDLKLLKLQLRSLGLAEVTKRMSGEWSANLELKEWWERYHVIDPLFEYAQILTPLTCKDKALKVKEILGWSDKDMTVGKNKVFLSDVAFRHLEDFLRAKEPEEHQRVAQRSNRQMTDSNDMFSPYLSAVPALANYNPQFARTTSTAALPLVGSHLPRGVYDDEDFDTDYDRKTMYTDTGDEYGSRMDEERSIAPSDFGLARPEEEKDVRGIDDEEVIEEVTNTSGRKKWVFLTWLFTWWIPSFLLSYLGGMKRSDVRMAWREKLLINMLIWLLCGSAVFVIAILGNLICPKEYVFSSQELAGSNLNAAPKNMLVAIRGEAFDLTKFAPLHQPGISVIPLRLIQRYGGLDATPIFPVQVSALCNGVTGSISPWVTLSNNNNSIPNVQYHDFRAATNDSRPDWYYETMVYLRYNFRKGFIGFTPSDIARQAKAGTKIAIYDGGVYDMSDYIANNGGGVSVPVGQSAPAVDRLFMSSSITSLFATGAGSDITNTLNTLNLDPTVLAAQKVCLRNLFFVGKVDHRNSVQCQFSRYILLALSIFMVSIIAFKFLSALQFGRRRKPEDYDKFVICQVPCYTEGEESLRNCINSLTRLKYDDKRKLLFVICDGMIVGSGNDRPTPRIVLDILGADPAIDPEPLSFESIGNGAKQHNMAKVYSGLYEAAGHIVPYIVIVKVGKPTERSRPGNRGKRDSQMLLMRFLNRVHFDAPMAPLELEMYHQIKNVIGVNPSFYEYLFMVDADTVVEASSLNYLVGSFVEDKKVIGLCGETSLSNARASWTTMMQVYEYFISHYLSKAFESLFGSVTCLPGCFSVYRIRTVDHRPLIISNTVVREYGQNKVETLHVKNLLSLGEDRYLTTVMMKEFPEFKMKFCKDAQAQTIAPDDWKVLMSQRRRWINSTVHNLAELLFIDKMCGFCCFSMRFVVFVDLMSTVIAPVTVAYIGYLIYLVAAEGKPVPTTALIMLGAIYGLQAIIYILHRKFEHIGWMIVYIMAIPVFSFILPLASFWQMDDFSWGSTREIVGERGKRLIIHDEGKFDPASIPLKSWAAFEDELWEAGSNASIGSLIAASKREEGDSRYGGETPRQSGIFDQQSYRNRNSVAGSYNPLNAPSPAPGSAFGVSSGVSPSNSGYFGNFPPSTSNLDLGGPPNYRNSSLASSPRAMSPSPAQMLEGSGGLPSDDMIIAHVQQILSVSDLNTLSKKGVRQELEAMYGVSLADRRALVNSTIEAMLGLET